MTGDATGDGYLVANEHGVVVDVNDVVCRLLALERADIVGRSLASRDQVDLLGDVGERWPQLQEAGEIAGSMPSAHADGIAPSVEYVAQSNIPVAGWTMVRLRTSASETRGGSGVS